jgi:hypothetical protein
MTLCLRRSQITKETGRTPKNSAFISVLATPCGVILDSISLVCCLICRHWLSGPAAWGLVMFYFDLAPPGPRSSGRSWRFSIRKTIYYGALSGTGRLRARDLFGRVSPIVIYAMNIPLMKYCIQCEKSVKRPWTSIETRSVFTR